MKVAEITKVIADHGGGTDSPDIMLPT